MFIPRLVGLRQSTLNKLSLLKERIKLPEKWKGGRIEKWSNFWVHLVEDYKIVATDTVQGAQARPYKAIFVASGLGTAFTAIQTNPDEQSFYDNLVQCATTLTMVSDPVRNPTTEQHLQYLSKCQNQDLLRRTDLIFFTLMWVADYNRDCDIYAAQCKYLKPRYLTFYERIIDVGVFGTWLNLRRKMTDYDINPSEWNEIA